VLKKTAKLEAKQLVVTDASICASYSVPCYTFLLANKQICVHVTFALHKDFATALKFEHVTKFGCSKLRHLRSQSQSATSNKNS